MYHHVNEFGVGAACRLLQSRLAACACVHFHGDLRITGLCLALLGRWCIYKQVGKHLCITCDKNSCGLAWSSLGSGSQILAQLADYPVPHWVRTLKLAPPGVKHAETRRMLQHAHVDNSGCSGHAWNPGQAGPATQLPSACAGMTKSNYLRQAGKDVKRTITNTIEDGWSVRRSNQSCCRHEAIVDELRTKICGSKRGQGSKASLRVHVCVL